MGYVGEPFAHDVFVSYGHGDVDQVGDSPIKRWSQAFVERLQWELNALPGQRFNVFLDQNPRPAQGLDPMAPLTAEIRDGVIGSALLLVLMSPYYLRSEWCAEERKWWIGRQRELGLDYQHDVAIARIWPCAETDVWPPELLDQAGKQPIGFWFYDRANEALHPQPYEWPAPDEKSKGEFLNTLLGLVARLKLRMDDIKKLVEERRQAQADAQKLASGSSVVYLHGRADQRPAWEAANAELTNTGMTVFPGEPDPVAADPKDLQRLRDSRVEILSGCDALLLLGGPDGRAIDADMIVVGRQDRHSARARANRLLPCGLLDRVGQPVATPQRKAAARALQVDWLDSTQRQWTTDVARWLAQKGNALGLQR